MEQASLIDMNGKFRANSMHNLIGHGTESQKSELLQDIIQVHDLQLPLIYLNQSHLITLLTLRDCRITFTQEMSTKKVDRQTKNHVECFLGRGLAE